VADIAPQQLRPDAETTCPIKHPTAPRALMDEPVGGARIGQPIQGGQWQLHAARLDQR